jgi:riboflavin synthase alpha subunit
VFTGIVEECGEVRSLEDHRLAVACRVVTSDSHVGDSVALNGV